MFFTPENSFGKHVYHYAIDIWTMGFIFAELMFKTEHNFLASEGMECHEKLKLTVEVLGTKNLYAYLKKFGLWDDIKDEYKVVLGEVGDV